MDEEFRADYATKGRPSIRPERLFKAWLRQILFSIRCERILVKHIRYKKLNRCRFMPKTPGLAWSTVISVDYSAARKFPV